MSFRRTYERPVAGWWRSNPYFLRYMAREVTAVFVAAYALILLVGLVRLSQGAGAYESWLQALRSPASIAFHLLLLAVFAYHTWSWFEIMPKTMPPVVVGGRRVAPRLITAAGLLASLAASLALYLAARVLAA